MSVKDESQILRDINRTFPENFYFRDGDGCKLLEQILINLCKVDNIRGYIQGMNFLAGSLLLHSNEFIAFGIMEVLLVDYELKEVYSS